MPRSKSARTLEDTKEFFLWCKRNMITKASDGTFSVEFHPLAFIDEATPKAQQDAVQELLKASREADAKAESNLILGGALTEEERKRKEDEELFWSSTG